jgi:small subunit ribosomal protein S14
MSRLGAIEREKRMTREVKKYSQERSLLKAKLKDSTLSNVERFAAQAQLEYKKTFRLQIRQRNRCGITGDARSFYKKFGLGRNELRKLASYNLIPGFKKASW